MKTLILTIFAMLNSSILFSQLENMYAHRMITDFNGVVGNENVVLCYGNWGIITYSNDKGETWKQQNLGDKYNIKRMFKSDNVFYGVTEYSLLKSTNDGRTWHNKHLIDTAEFIDFSLSEEYIYVLGKSSIQQYDFSLNPITTNLYELNPEWTYKEMVYHNNHLIINCINEWNDNYILKINLVDITIDSLLIAVENHCSTCSEVINLKVYNDNVYFLFDHSYKDYLTLGANQLYNTLACLNLNNNSLSIISNKIEYSNCYQFYNNEIYTLSGKDFSFRNSRFIPQLYKIEDENYVSISENQDENLITYYNNSTELLRFVDFIFDADLIVAVGTDKIIYISNNRGKTWECKSFTNFKRQGINTLKYQFINDSSIVVFFNSLSHYCCYTSNGGITWSPIYSDLVPGYASLASQYHFDDRFKGLRIVTPNETVNVDNVFFYNNYYINSKYYPEVFDINRIALSEGKRAYILDEHLIKTNNYYIGYNYIDDRSKHPRKIYSNIYFFDTEYKFVKNIVLDSIRIKNIIKIYDIYYVYGQKYYLDTVMNEIINWVLLKSIDNCHNWELIDDSVPPLSMSSINYLGNSYSFSNIIYNFYSDYSKHDIPKLIMYNIDESIHSSIDLDIDLTNYGIMGYKDNVFAFSRTRDLLSLVDNAIVSYSHLLYNWDTNKINLNYQCNEVISPWTDGNTIYLCIGEFTGLYSSNTPIYSLNFVRFSSTPTTSVENQTESPTYLYTYPAYPNPARNQVRAMVYWDLRHDINTADIEVYDVMGVRVSGKENISIANATAYNGEIVWDCGSVPEGVYFIKITHGTSTKTVKVAVVR